MAFSAKPEELEENVIATEMTVVSPQEIALDTKVYNENVTQSSLCKGCNILILCKFDTKAFMKIVYIIQYNPLENSINSE